MISPLWEGWSRDSCMYMTDSSSVREWQFLSLSADCQRKNRPFTQPATLNTSTPGPCHYFLKLHIVHYLSKTYLRDSPVAQWLRIRLPMQGTWVRALIREDPTGCGATKLMRHNYWACALEPMSHNYWAREPQLLSPRAATTEVHMLRACAPQQGKPPQWEARTLQRRVAPPRCN